MAWALTWSQEMPLKLPFSEMSAIRWPARAARRPMRSRRVAKHFGFRIVVLRSNWLNVKSQSPIRVRRNFQVGANMTARTSDREGEKGRQDDLGTSGRSADVGAAGA